MRKDQRKFLELFKRVQLSVETRRRIRTIIAVIVVFATTYSLVLPAITLESNNASKMAGLNLSGQSGRELGCHFNVHKHTDACYKEVPVYDADGVQYTTKKVLSCGKADWIVHTHDENCYQNGQLVCTLPEHAEHIHNADCYTRQRVLSCGKEENPGHQHTDACYEETRELACGQQEHVHTDACYASDDGNEENAEHQLTCGLEEHIHTDECYKTENNLICGMEEEEGHTHTDACYTEQDVLTCGESELHTHNINCFEKGPNGESPLEMGWVTLETDENGNEVLCGDPDHLICGKLELLAHQHDDTCFVETEQQDVDAGVGTEGEGLGAGIDGETLDGGADGENLDTGADGAYSDVGTVGEDFAPETDGTDSDAGIEGADQGTDGTALDDANVIFMDPEAEENQIEDLEIITDEDAEKAEAEKTEAEQAEAEKAESEKEEKEKTADDASGNNEEKKSEETYTAFTRTVDVEGAPYSLKIECSEECKIPENAEFRATALAEDREDYEAYRDRALAAVESYTEDENSRAKEMPGLFDLTIYGEDGTEMQPSAPLSVSIDMGDAIGEDAAGVYAVHFPGTGLDTIMTPAATNPVTKAAQIVSEKINGTGAEVIETNDGENGAVQFEAGTVQFEAGGLSVYAIVYTVDFKYEINGKTYEFSLNGGDTVSFRDLLNILHVLDEDADVDVDEFLADVDDIKFSDEDLVKVVQITEGITAGGLKQKWNLEPEYSAELTKAQIEKMNEKVFYAPDWALVSMKAFDTDEYLLVTMKTGETFRIQVTDAQISKTVISARGETYEITVTYDDSAEIPDGAELKVREILPETEEYQGYLQDAVKEMGTENEAVSFARFFDIVIANKNGEKVEPKTPVQVEVTYEDSMNISGTERLNIIHFAEEKTEVINDISIADDNKKVTYEQCSFSVTGTIISEPPQGQENKYMILINYPNGSGNYYIVNNDGSLTKVNYNASNGTVDVEDPMLWTIDGTNPNRHIYFNTEATGFNYQDTAADYFRRYLDPNSESGITEENSENITLGRRSGDNVKTGYVVTNRSNMLSQTAINNYNDNGVEKIYHGDWNDNLSLGVELDAEGNPVHVSGKNNWSDAANVVFAEPRSVPNVGTSHHTVDHIDISISGKSDIKVPLAYGTYYYQDAGGNWHEYVVTEAKTLDLEKDNVSITAEDMKHATIKAYNSQGEELNNAFVIDGYSSNASNAYSTVQVRIGGRFKVADTYDGGRNDWQTKQRRLNNKITYNVSAIKELTFDLEDDEHGQLYEKLPDGTYHKMSVTIDVNMSAAFDYWDERNECPGIKNEIIWGSHDEWVNGGIPTHGLSGMDFVLGGDAEEAGSKIVAVEITKLIVDENGQRISPADSEHIVNSFDLYQDADGNPNSVVGLDIDTYTTPANYDGYSHLHSKGVKVGPDGIGLVYDYAVTPGMFYIQENQDSIPDNILDSNGETWHYAGTRIETESPWRNTPDYDGHMHVSDTYVKSNDTLFNSIPEVLGNYNDIHGNTTWYNQETGKDEEIRNGFLEFFVYNIYEPEKTEVKVEKKWENGTAPDGASVDVVLKRYKLVKDGSITPPEPTTADMTITDSYSGLSGDRTYSATYHVVGPDNYNKTFEWAGDPITISNLSFGEYTVTKTASAQDGYDAINLTEEQIITLGVAGAAVSFEGTSYTRQSTDDIYHQVLIYANDTSNQGTEHIVNGHYAWVDEEYLAGTQLEFKVGVPGWNNNSNYSYSINGGNPVTIGKGSTKTQNITVDRDITIVIYGSTPYYNQWLDPVPSVSVVSVPGRASMLSFKKAPLRGSSIYEISNNGKNPEIEGYTWQEDTTWHDGNGLTVHLPDAESWEKTVGDLEKEDPYGNVYVYYIDSVTENGMPSGMTVEITLEGENKMFVYGDHSEEEGSVHTNDTLKVKNILATATTVTIQKVIKGTSTPLTGAKFNIRKYNDPDHKNEITEGYPIDKTVGANGQIVLDNLEVGYYKLEETTPPPGYIKISEDPYFTIQQNESTKELEVIFTNTDMVTYQNGTFTVQNEPGSSLPNTGGPGTSLLYLAGMMLIMMAGTGLMMSKRQRRNH